MPRYDNEKIFLLPGHIRKKRKPLFCNVMACAPAIDKKLRVKNVGIKIKIGTDALKTRFSEKATVLSIPEYNF